MATIATTTTTTTTLLFLVLVLSQCLSSEAGWIVKSSTSHSIASQTNVAINWATVQASIVTVAPVVVKKSVARTKSAIVSALGPLNEMRSTDKDEIAEWALFSKNTEHKQFSYHYVDAATVTGLVAVNLDASGETIVVGAAQVRATAKVDAKKKVVTKHVKKKKVFGIKTGSKSSSSTSYVSRAMTAGEHQILLSKMLDKMVAKLNQILRKRNLMEMPMMN
eukprot:TRINITY_DN237_c0_g1_i1.p1 TRINITY_DN237_c0_g1~~TRINITY_DN237_c0_g1_i1.p1  ORF type:complete len:228 (-),score=69.81 TRINITY_DN237_c0_g1_i1:35-697(-)